VAGEQLHAAGLLSAEQSELAAGTSFGAVSC
jgi:hypothetical protein